jgi:hypothetical protein
LRARPVVFRAPDLRLRPELDFLLVLDRRRAGGALLPSDSASSSPLLKSFLATPTAAGIATPTAAPATTFFVVDIPSSSIADVSSSLATIASVVED